MPVLAKTLPLDRPSRTKGRSQLLVQSQMYSQKTKAKVVPLFCTITPSCETAFVRLDIYDFSKTNGNCSITFGNFTTHAQFGLLFQAEQIALNKRNEVLKLTFAPDIGQTAVSLLIQISGTTTHCKELMMLYIALQLYMYCLYIFSTNSRQKIRRGRNSAVLFH